MGTAVGRGLLFALFCLAKALHMGVFALLGGLLCGPPGPMPAVAALWVAIEVTHGSLGFAWLTLGNAGIDMGVPMRLAPFTGVYGLSFVFAMMSAALALALLRRPRWNWRGWRLLPLLILLPRLPDSQRGRASGASGAAEHLRHRGVDPADFRGRTERAAGDPFVAAVMSDRSQPPQLLVWPEVPAPFYDDDPEYLRLARQSRARHAHIFPGGVVGHRADGGPLNSALLVAPIGRSREPL